MNILMFSGSLRKDSLNKKLIRAASTLLSGNSSNHVTVIDLKTLSLPVYDGDIEAEGIPEGARILGEHIKEAQAIIISTPEYNGSIAGSLKNTIDWVSRLKPSPLGGKPVLLMGASPGYFGAIRGLGATRAPFEALGCFLYPQSFALPKADEAFAASGNLVDEANTKKLETLLTSYLKFAQSSFF